MKRKRTCETMKRKEQKKKQLKNTSTRSKQLEARGVSMDMETSWAAQELTTVYTNLNDMARFQQKQLQEKEQKLLQLYDQQQQRAYQVVQRASAGSNGSSHTAISSQHTVTRTSTSSHTTPTSHGGKVRQMFDERRQTVKGIDRSYPLEPLENKPRKQTHVGGGQRNGNLTVNRQSVTVRRVARADVNSNLNGGKPVVSYHEEITRESYGPSVRQLQDDDEFGNENRIGQYTNGNETRIEEIGEQEAMERNRMMAKLHLMEYDDTLKHRVKNDLESEEFPADYMVDVPDKLPKQTVAKKLSQAEARLERFKNANAKRANSVAKATLTKKRSEPIHPSKSASSEYRAIKTRTQLLDRASSSRKENPGHAKSRTSKSIEEILSSDSEKNAKQTSPRFFCRESEKSATSYAIDAKTVAVLSSDTTKGRVRRSESPFSKESEKSATTYTVDSKNIKKSSPGLLNREKSRSQSPKFFCKESEKSATTYAIDSKTAKRFSPELSTDRIRRSESPKFFCKESEKSATTYAIDSKTAKRFSPELSTDRIRRSDSPKFFCKESEKSATTYAIDSKTAKRFSPELSTDRIRRSESPKFFCKESEKSATSYAIDSKTARKFSPELSKDVKKRSDSPKFFRRESEKSATTYTIDSRSRSTSPDYMRATESSLLKLETKNKKNILNNVIKESVGIDTVDPHIKSSSTSESPKYDRINKTQSQKKPLNAFERLKRERSSSPQFFCREGRRSATTMSIDSKNIRSKSDSSDTRIKKHDEREVVKSKSPDVKSLRKSNISPEFFTSDSERSATIIIVKPETITKQKTETELGNAELRTPSPAKTVITPMTERRRETSEVSDNESSKRLIRSSVSRFFSEKYEKALRDANVDDRSDGNVRLSRDSSPLSLRDLRTPSPSTSYRGGVKTLDGSTDRSSSRASSPKSRKNAGSRGETPEFYCYETRKSATTVSLKPKNVTKGRSKSLGLIERKVTAVPSAKRRSPTNQLKNGSSRSQRGTEASDRRGSSNVLRSIKLIRDAMKRQTDRNQADYAWKKRARESRSSSAASGISSDSKLRLKSCEARKEIGTGGKVDGASPRELRVAESNPESSAEVDTESLEITIPDQYIKQEQLRGTYSKSVDKTVDGGKSSVGKLFTYSVRKPVKKRRSLFDSKVLEPSGIKDSQGACDQRKTDVKREPWSSPSPTNLVARGFKRQTEKNTTSRTKEKKFSRFREQTSTQLKQKDIRKTFGNLKQVIRDAWSSSPSPTNESIIQESKRRAGNIINRRNESEMIKSCERTQSPIQRKARGTIIDEPKVQRTSGQVQILKSMELVQRAMGKSSVEKRKSSERAYETISDGIVKEKRAEVKRRGSSSSTIVSIKGGASFCKDYGRTDSVESALRRFDSIGTEGDSESMRSTLERNKKSMTEKKQTKPKPISLKALDRPSRNLSVSPESKPSSTSSSRRTSVSPENRAREKMFGQKKFAAARDSLEIARIAIRSKSPACKRKLFQGDDSEAESSKYSFGRLSPRSNKSVTPESLRSASPSKSIIGDHRSSTIDTGKIDETAVSDDHSLSVKPLRSIEDIRKSINGESCNRDAKGTRKSAIASNASRRINIDDRAGRKKDISSRSGKIVVKNADPSSVKCAMRFSRVVKSPSPEATKETSTRARRNVPASPSKSPDTVARRPSTELKAQDTKPTKRPTPMKGTEPIGNRKTTTTTTSTRKSTDVVDGTILENGLRLGDQTAETKYDNGSSATRKGNAFVIDFDEQPPKDNDTPPQRKPLLRKHSEILSTQSGRLSSSVPSTSNGSSMQGQTTTIRSKLATRAKTPTSASVSQRGSTSGKTPPCPAAADSLVPCKICGRRFAQDRVTLHEQICAKTAQKERKKFDTTAFRVKGTDIEPFYKKGLLKKPLERSKKPEVKTNWRRKHEDFIKAIRSAKEVQAHLAAGGKLSDLPPPPVSDNCDYIQCPHCKRRFNQAAAERHIPKCEHMLHNKPIHSRAPKPRR
ncbi:uncharacterized protein LOC108623920 isoform X2 [Ceratina calcarata]|uniref:Uncharacterized protein LOC108623920 isoform X2 n=1 Tax=Ceratina calcarata TaxID=156304 RepID=A0AAJ7W9L5_9HYME|nr:uncharacterized protein LOC108623920 isoform X2 [Ceratina calcarata]